MRREGLSGAGIGTVTKDAGLTHGAFYAHFNNKEEMLVSAFRHALAENRPHWTSPGKDASWPDRLERLAKRYLTPEHRDHLSDSCALAALLSEAARSSNKFRRAYEEELLKSLDAICGKNPCDAVLEPKRFEDAVMFFALCVGGISLSRAVDDRDFSDQILSICREAAGKIGGGGRKPGEDADQESNASMGVKNPHISLDQYPVKTYEKIRYADTDRQGHVNSAVFSTMVETGRVKILYNPDNPLAGPNCSFVIASQKLDFLSEITWPSRVDIGTRIQKVSRSSISLETALFKEDGNCAATAQTVIVQVDNNTKRSHPLSTEVKQYLNSLGVSGA